INTPFAFVVVNKGAPLTGEDQLAKQTTPGAYVYLVGEGEEAVFAFNRNNNIPYYYVRLGITVSETVYKLQDEFLERDYP
ncbi:hypothetical protein, partial [Pseudomonas aeruginosa]|uniref:hypothetical protein n=1 Tax=Pseudomonas aeruginosa TaxID=287 RepID=UPI001BD255BF